MFPAAEQRAPKLMGFLDLAAASVASLQPVSKKHQPEPSALDRKRSRKHPKKGEGRRSIPLDCCTIVVAGIAEGLVSARRATAR